MADKARYLRNKALPSDGYRRSSRRFVRHRGYWGAGGGGGVFCFKKFEWTSSKVFGVGLHASPRVEAATKDWRHNLVALVLCDSPPRELEQQSVFALRVATPERTRIRVVCSRLGPILRKWNAYHFSNPAPGYIMWVQTILYKWTNERIILDVRYIKWWIRGSEGYDLPRSRPQAEPCWISGRASS